MEQNASDFHIELDRIDDYNELYYNLNKLTLKDSWSYLRTDTQILIFKLATSSGPPKLQIVLKIDKDLKISLWIEDVSIEVNLFWKVLGIDPASNGLRYSILLNLIKFLDTNQMMVTNRKKRWELDASEVKKVIEDGSNYCRVCFKHFEENFELNENFIEFLGVFADVVLEERFSQQFCRGCADFIEEIFNFREFVLENENILNKIDEPKEDGADEMVLIRTNPAVEEWLVEEVSKVEAEPKVEVVQKHEFACNSCEKSYPNRATLTKHMSRVHTPATEMCSVCDKGPFNPYKLQCHMHFHELRHECGICKKRFAHPAPLKVHIEKIHSTGPSHFCVECNVEFPTKRKLKEHLTEMHGLIEEVKKLVQCHFCGNKYGQKSSLINHFRRGCEQDPDVVKSSLAVCKVCDKVFKTKADLQPHMKTHTAKYSCPICSVKFTLKSSYHRHLETHENQERKFDCEECGATYSKIEHMKTHIARAHVRIFKHQCQFCQKGFMSTYELNDHERTHTNERPFACTHSGCTKSYRTRSTLRVHLMRHTNYFYSCKYCMRKFRNINTLINHCKKLHADDYQSDDELEFVPLVEVPVTKEVMEQELGKQNVESHTDETEVTMEVYGSENDFQILTFTE